MSKSEIKEQVLYNREGFDALVDYAFDRFVPEFAVETSEGIYRLIYDPLVKR